MAFGDFYHYEEQAVVLKPGVYDVVLTRIFETMINSYKVLKFEFRVEGISSRTSPGNFVLFDVTNPEDFKEISMFNKKASKIKECFMLKGPFCESNYVAWQGKKGKIYIEKDDTGFTNVKNFYPNENLTDTDRTML